MNPLWKPSFTIGKIVSVVSVWILGFCNSRKRKVLGFFKIIKLSTCMCTKHYLYLGFITLLSTPKILSMLLQCTNAFFHNAWYHQNLSCVLNNPVKSNKLQHVLENDQNFILKFLNNLDINDKFTQESDLIYFQDRLLILCESCLIPSPLQEFHFSLMGGPSNINATLARVSVGVYWPEMHIDVQNFVLKCKFVDTRNTTHISYNLLELISIPTQIWEESQLILSIIYHL